MITLALELSSAQGSLALLSDEHVVAEEQWNEKNAHAQEFFRRLPGLMSRARQRIEDVDCFAAGRGPGSYSGLRSAVTAAQALALPGGKPVFTVSSGEALAREIADREHASAVAVIGDARRGTLWMGVFGLVGQELTALKPWAVIRSEELPTALPDGVVVATPDWSRLTAVIEACPGPRVRWIPGDSYPTATWVGRVAVERIRKGTASEPLTPIYMHPAVATR